MTVRSLLLVAFFAAAVPLAGRAQSPKPAELIVTGGRIYTVDDTRPIVEAFAVSKGHFVFVGTSRDAMLFKGPSTRVLDVHGATVYPGFIDAHAHMLGLGLALSSVDLVGAPSYEEVVSRVAARAKTVPAGQWITGQRLGSESLDREGISDERCAHARGARSSGELDRVDGHALLANAAAMRAAGITRSHADPEGGRIIRDADGTPTGVFVDNAQELIQRALPDLTPKQLSDAIHAAAVECNKWGLTEVQDMGSGRATIEAFESLARAGSLPLRSYNMVTDDKADLDFYFARVPARRSTMDTCGCAASSSTPTARSAPAALHSSRPTATT